LKTQTHIIHTTLDGRAFIVSAESHGLLDSVVRNHTEMVVILSQIEPLISYNDPDEISLPRVVGGMSGLQQRCSVFTPKNILSNTVYRHFYGIQFM
jgi:hypothetical protein